MTPPDDVHERLQEIRERVEAATEGPRKDPLWFRVSALADWVEAEFNDKGPNECLGPRDVEDLRQAKRFLRSDVPYLLSLVERYQKALLDWDQDVCWCGHPRIDHAAHDASPRCFIDGCDCEGYAALRDAAQEGEG